jgi:hypothetical protein
VAVTWENRGFPCVSVVSGKLDSVKAAERAKRDAQIMKLFYAGASYRQISEAVGLRSPQSIANVVQREMAAGGDQREFMADESRAVWVERWQQLWRANYPAAMAGDHRALAECRRLQGQWATMFGLSRMPPLAGADIDVDEDQDDDDAAAVAPMDELARLRAARAGVEPAGAGADVLGGWKVADFRN